MRSKPVLEICTLSLGLFLLGGALAAGCTGDSESPSGSPKASSEAAHSQLRVSFPAQADQVLAASGEFAETPRGFESAGQKVTADLPRDSAEPVRLRLDDGWEVQVREQGVKGAGATVERSVTYRRAGGTSYWTAVPGGVEEWVHLEAGAASRGGVAASWNIAGAKVVQHGDAVGLFDTKGVARLWITAPAAYTAGGKPISVRLAARGTTIDVSIDATPEEVLIDPAWSTAAPMSVGRNSHAAVRLGSGQAFVIGGTSTWTSYDGFSSTEAYDVTTNTWTTKAPMAVGRGYHTATVLGDGRVLVVGGLTAFSSALSSTEIYNPSTNTWTAGPSLSGERYNHRAVTLTNGKVLIIGGQDSSFNRLASTELFDPATNTFSSTASTRVAHWYYFAATRLADGRPIVVGGDDNLTAVETYDPSTDTWSFAASMLHSRANFGVELLPNGKVLAAGGDGLSNNPGRAELYNPSTNTWSLTGPQQGFCGSFDYSATALMNDGRVLIVGDVCGSIRSETYDPTSNSWSSDAVSTERQNPTLTLLSDGQVLVAGGLGTSTATQLYAPLLQNGTACTSNSQCTTNRCIEGVCCSSCPTNVPACQTCTVANGASADGVCTYITTGSCAGSDNGIPCSTSSGCSSGNCVDGVCCDTACGGGSTSDCQVCSVAQGALTNGTCRTLTTGPTCGAPNGTSCTSNFTCASNFCADGVCCNSACGGSSTLDCQACSVAAGASGDGTCQTITTSPCGKANGAACAAAVQCTSGNCVDGVCCNSACGGSTTDCQACSTAAGATGDGTCQTIYAGSCALGNGSACTSASMCASGNCVDGYCCNTACGGNNTSDCQACSVAAGASANGTCTTLTTGSCGSGGSSNGTACSSGSSCTSGNCVDGVCCNSACGGNNTTDCQACSVAAGATTNGTCATLTTGSCAPTTTCITIQRGTSGTVNEAHVNSSGANTNYGANATLSTGSTGAGNTRYGLLRFDLSAIPSTATITTATLTLGVFSGGGAAERAHRITSSWSESTVTWNNFASAFNATVELTMTGTTTYSGSLASLVQSWVNGTYANYGIALERDLTGSTSLYASEWATTSLRPQLYVCYQ